MNKLIEQLEKAKKDGDEALINIICSQIFYLNSGQHMSEPSRGK